MPAALRERTLLLPPDRQFLTLTQPIKSMFTSKACTATCVLDGKPVTLTFFPDSTLLRITDANGHCMRETRWPAPWRTLLATLREFSGHEARDQLSTLLDSFPATSKLSREHASALA
ncbi:hypothetical protein [Caballeronia sp. LZ029]|uniref:hypothetical protein n=1 Tax=Caballeronia sp. LZ029 TaxID=3038564 RepID=UPI003857F4AC